MFDIHNRETTNGIIRRKASDNILHYQKENHQPSWGEKVEKHAHLPWDRLFCPSSIDDEVQISVSSIKTTTINDAIDDDIAVVVRMSLFGRWVVLTVVSSNGE
jgi:hypothetical protein